MEKLAQNMTVEEAYALGLEAAAKVADDEAILALQDGPPPPAQFRDGREAAARHIAAAIRSLIK